MQPTLLRQRLEKRIDTDSEDNNKEPEQPQITRKLDKSEDPNSRIESIKVKTKTLRPMSNGLIKVEEESKQ